MAVASQMTLQLRKQIKSMQELLLKTQRDAEATAKKHQDEITKLSQQVKNATDRNSELMKFAEKAQKWPQDPVSDIDICQ